MLPSQEKDFPHKLSYAERQIQHLTSLLENGAAKNPEARKMIEDTLQGWEKIRDRLIPEVVTTESPMQKTETRPWSFRDFCSQHSIASPDNCTHFVESSEAHEMILKIEEAISHLPEDSDLKYNRILTTWTKIFKSMRTRLNMSFGTPKKKNLPAEYLANKKRKRENSQLARSNGKNAKDKKK